MSMGSEDTFIFSVLLQTKILQPLLQGLGVYVTKPGKYAMVQGKFQNKCLCPILNCIFGAVIISHRCRGMCVLWKMAQARVPKRFIEKAKFQQYH